MSEKPKNATANSPLADLEALVSRLDAGLGSGKRRDAIDAILASSPRTTQVESLRDHEAIQRFRKEFADGLIRVDTARQLLGLIRVAVDAVMK